MNNYNVEINFKKGPSFTAVSVTAETPNDATVLAFRYAKNNGFYEAVKKYKVKKLAI